MFTPDILIRRAEIVREMRAYFDGLGFVEVETPVRIAAPAPEPHIDCPLAPVADFAVSGSQPSTFDLQTSTCLYLRASPELQMKKLLAKGMDRIYQIGPCFREGERGRRHNPEFTMIEWYRRGEDYRKIAEDLKGLLQTLARGRGTRLAFETLTVRDAYVKFAGWDPWTGWDQDRFDFDMATKIEPALKTKGAVFLTDYPPAAASLAKLRGDVAERWEFYWHGLELANCFSELCDADEQFRRFEIARTERRALGEADYPIDVEFLETLPAIGAAAGVALGVDRLVMLLTGAPDISSVRTLDCPYEKRESRVRHRFCHNRDTMKQNKGIIRGLGWMGTAVLAAGTAFAEPEPFVVDFSKPTGVIRKLNGVCNATPLSGSRTRSLNDRVLKLEIPAYRFHDASLENPGIELVDISRIFPLFHADADDPRNYDFRATDDYLKQVVATGAEIEFRLGESIEHSKNQYFVHPPKDYAKWAEICVRIIRHYNEGWANGYRWNIRR